MVSEKGAVHGSLAKTLTGIHGLDEITLGGLPRGRPTLVCGSAGCGKTLLAMEFLVRGAIEFGEPGAFIAFEETTGELTENVRSLGFDLDTLTAERKLAIEYIHIERSEIEETGEYDLEGLFLRVGLAIDSVGAKRVVLDTLEALFGGFDNPVILRAELRRLFRWLKDRGVSCIITAERGDGTLTRHGLEEYVSDCVILLDHRVNEQISTRRIRVVKYRGSIHGTNEYPFVIDETGISVLPITSLALEHPASTERISSGVPGLDAMLGGQGYYRGSSILVSGTAGTGKTSLAAHFADATCRRGERCLYLAFEESQAQLVRNMRSIGLDLEPWLHKGLLRFHAWRPTMQGVEMHLITIHKLVKALQPQVVILDPISNFTTGGTVSDVHVMFMRLFDVLKSSGITALFTDLTTGGNARERTDVGVSSLIDTWLLLRDIELGGERNRGMYVLKSRGMPHSNQICEFLLTDHGIELAEVYAAPEGVLTGSARLAQDERVKAESLARHQEAERKRAELERRRNALDAQITALRAELDATDEEVRLLRAQYDAREMLGSEYRAAMMRRRGVVEPAGVGADRKGGKR